MSHCVTYNICEKQLPKKLHDLLELDLFTNQRLQGLQQILHKVYLRLRKTIWTKGSSMSSNIGPGGREGFQTASHTAGTKLSFTNE